MLLWSLLYYSIQEMRCSEAFFTRGMLFWNSLCMCMMYAVLKLSAQEVHCSEAFCTRCSLFEAFCTRGRLFWSCLCKSYTFLKLLYKRNAVLMLSVRGVRCSEVFCKRGTLFQSCLYKRYAVLNLSLLFCSVPKTTVPVKEEHFPEPICDGGALSVTPIICVTFDFKILHLFKTLFNHDTLSI